MSHSSSPDLVLEGPGDVVLTENVGENLPAPLVIESLCRHDGHAPEVYDRQTFPKLAGDAKRLLAAPDSLTLPKAADKPPRKEGVEKCLEGGLHCVGAIRESPLH